jgi:uncharacterized protein CXXCG
MQFWKLECPEYDSDYRYSYINGALEHPFGMPGIKCDACGETWGGSRILPYVCPRALRKRKHLTDGWPIPLKQHRMLQEEVRHELHKAGIEIADLRPGDEFQPCYLDVPSRPRADFLWGSLGSVVVSQRMKDLFESAKTSGLAFSSVVLRKIGKREAKLPPPIPSTGEPEDMLREMPLLKQKDGVGPYYEMLILSESARPPGGDPKSICSGCGREDIDTEKRLIVMVPSMWKGDDIFFLATTLYIVITERVKTWLEDLGATNVAFRKIATG